ncbi:MAG: WhiB family transcriptional regulator [Candidatus Ancillula sp.]|nr:WhiB family transcriptional regulator [Candidatus Ancillula sp.]
MYDDKNGQWQVNAKCRDYVADLFFPVGSSELAQQQTMEAKKVCSTCEVRLECLEMSLRTRRDTGIWGGATEQERKEMIRHFHVQKPNSNNKASKTIVDTEYYDDIMDYINLGKL